MADNVLVKIDEQVKGNKVIVYMKGTLLFPQCGFSPRTMEILQSYGYPFETVDALEGNEASRAFQAEKWARIMRF
ncbi:MAG: hypothetical protein HYV00_11285 [Deltaproteobacteria bacterium]|nr:hypothetical protein [Deltaproteobacteria bacterium]